MDTQDNNRLISMILRRELIIALLGIIAFYSIMAAILFFRQSSEYTERILHLEDKVSRMEGSKDIQYAMKREREVREEMYPKLLSY